ncbi:hypothetical protein [Streptomyces aureus]|uniref:hypothetical protein n=1 Tax=Streptomyces aureus TaxID=193461 RepID=UPI000B142FDD|nr:hypothetical protein [Streptomyces aureus]
MVSPEVRPGHGGFLRPSEADHRYANTAVTQFLPSAYAADVRHSVIDQVTH